MKTEIFDGIKSEKVLHFFHIDLYKNLYLQCITMEKLQMSAKCNNYNVRTHS